jgi:hypothetical protein
VGRSKSVHILILFDFSASTFWVPLEKDQPSRRKKRVPRNASKADTCASRVSPVPRGRVLKSALLRSRASTRAAAREYASLILPLKYVLARYILPRTGASWPHSPTAQGRTPRLHVQIKKRSHHTACMYVFRVRLCTHTTTYRT